MSEARKTVVRGRGEGCSVVEEVVDLGEESGSGVGLKGGHLVELGEHGRIHRTGVVEEDANDGLDESE